MAKYAPVGPIAVLEHLQSSGTLGGYLLLLAHDVLAHPRGYTKLVKYAFSAHKGKCFIIMDNSTIELGKPMSANEVIEAALIVNADCVVLPDVPGDFDATKALIKKDFDAFQDAGISIMKIPQGKDSAHLVACVDWMYEEVQVIGDTDYWGVPRWITNEIGSRKPIIQYINVRTSYKCSIHLLGMSRNLADDIGCTLLQNIIGIDSANPIVFGQAKKRMAYDVYIHMERGDYWNDTNVHPAVHDNIQYIRKQIGQDDGTNT